MRDVGRNADMGGQRRSRLDSQRIEQQMRHGMPPLQMCLNYGIMPSLSPDVDPTCRRTPSR